MLFGMYHTPISDIHLNQMDEQMLLGMCHTPISDIHLNQMDEQMLLLLSHCYCQSTQGFFKSWTTSTGYGTLCRIFMTLSSLFF